METSFDINPRPSSRHACAPANSRSSAHRVGLRQRHADATARAASTESATSFASDRAVRRLPAGLPITQLVSSRTRAIWGSFNALQRLRFLEVRLRAGLARNRRQRQAGTGREDYSALNHVFERGRFLATGGDGVRRGSRRGSNQCPDSCAGRTGARSARPSAGMSSGRSRSGGTSIGKTLRR